MTYAWLSALGILSIAWLVGYFYTKKINDPDMFFWIAVFFSGWAGVCIGAMYILSRLPACPTE